MRKLLKKIIEILDGTPAEYGKHQRGQSLVEMAFITPLLIILIAGLIEIAWLANNYLILLEVSRVGARRGTVLTGEWGPLEWNNRASLVPRTSWEPYTTMTGSWDALLPAADEDLRKDFRDCNNEIDQGFYNLIACIMIQSMDPLVLRTGLDPNIETGTMFYPDDIIVSVFALQAINNPDDIDFATDFSISDVPDGMRVHVVGRYPTNANECTVDADGDLLDTVPERDPFDYIENTEGDEYWVTDSGEQVYYELDGGDYSSGKQLEEFQRGFAWYGQHKVELDDWNTDEDVDCMGSQFTIERVETLVNLPGFDLNSDQREFLPTQGLVLVEIFWQHEMFLAFPLFSPVLDAMGERPTISAWAAFPAPGAEPNIQFP